jgi:hypothetical protein
MEESYLNQAVDMVHAAFPDGMEPWRRGFLLRAFRMEFTYRALVALAEALWEKSGDASWTSLAEMYGVSKISLDDHEVVRCLEAMMPFGFDAYMDGRVEPLPYMRGRHVVEDEAAGNAQERFSKGGFSKHPHEGATPTDSGWPSTQRIHLDAGAALNLATADSGMWAWSVKASMGATLQGKQLVMSQQAVDEVLGVAGKPGALQAAGPMESAALVRLMEQVQVVPNNPSLRIAAMRLTKGVGRANLNIFGTADRHKEQIVHTESRFVRAARAQGVALNELTVTPLLLVRR